MAMLESGEMYLETLYILLQEKTSVRSIDLAEAMDYSKPSVSRAIGLLKQDGFVATDQNGSLLLTEKGLNIAKTIYERHTVLSKLFMDLGVDEQTAVDDACRIEHYISEKTFNAIKNHIKKCEGHANSSVK